MPRTRLLAVTAAALLSLAACSGGSDGAKSEEDIHDSLAQRFEDDGLTEEQAGCYADLVIDEVGLDALREADVGDEEPPEAEQEAYAAAALRAVDECDITSADID
jgi:hypothetical protein